MVRLVALTALLCSSSSRAAHAGINAWTSKGPNDGPVLALMVDPHTPQTLYAGTSGEVFKSTDAGSTWSGQTMGLFGESIVVALAIDPVTPSTLYAGSARVRSSIGRVLKSTDGGASWNERFNSYAINALVIDPLTPSTLYAGTSSAEVFKTTDGGTSWIANNSGESIDVISLAIDPVTPTTLYAGGHYAGCLDKSTDGGTTWQGALGLNHVGVFALAIDPHTPSTLYAGLYGGNGEGVAKSTDRGATWIASNIGLADTAVTALVIDPHRPTTLYAGTDRGGVFRSTDGSTSWHTMNTGLTNTEVRALAIAPGTSPTVYAGTTAGVFAIQPASFTVNSTTDAPDAVPGDGVCATANGACTLRAAIESAGDGDQILFPAGTYILTAGALDIKVGLTLRGAGTATTRIDGAGTLQVMHIAAVSANIADLTIQNGGAYDGGGINNSGDAALTNVVISGNSPFGAYGGGIYNSGRLTLVNCSISDNTLHDGGGPAFGGGLSNFGEAMLVDVTLRGNTAEGKESAGGWGGALYNGPGGTLTLTDVTIADNTANSTGGGIANEGTLALTNSTLIGNRCGGFAAGRGGGLFNSGSVTLTNTTLSANTAEQSFEDGTGGGIFNFGTATLTNVTISGNAAADGGGVYSGGCAELANVTISGNTNSGIHAIGGGCTPQLRNTIVTSNPGDDCVGGISGLGHNLSSDGTCGGFDLSNVDPKLGPLQDNGGPTFTQALLPGSPAIDAGSPDCPPPDTDQRGVRRPQGSACDIGAYEFGPLACRGDCDVNGEVTVDELVRGVAIALGNLSLSRCPALDTNGDHTVTVDELVAAADETLHGCWGG